MSGWNDESLGVGADGDDSVAGVAAISGGPPESAWFVRHGSSFGIGRPATGEDPIFVDLDDIANIDQIGTTGPDGPTVEITTTSGLVVVATFPQRFCDSLVDSLIASMEAGAEPDLVPEASQAPPAEGADGPGAWRSPSPEGEVAPTPVAPLEQVDPGGLPPSPPPAANPFAPEPTTPATTAPAAVSPTPVVPVAPAPEPVAPEPVAPAPIATAPIPPAPIAPAPVAAAAAVPTPVVGVAPVAEPVAPTPGPVAPVPAPSTPVVPTEQVPVVPTGTAAAPPVAFTPTPSAPFTTGAVEPVGTVEVAATAVGEVPVLPGRDLPAEVASTGALPKDAALPEWLRDPAEQIPGAPGEIGDDHALVIENVTYLGGHPSNKRKRKKCVGTITRQSVEVVGRGVALTIPWSEVVSIEAQNPDEARFRISTRIQSESTALVIQQRDGSTVLLEAHSCPKIPLQGAISQLVGGAGVVVV